MLGKPADTVVLKFNGVPLEACLAEIASALPEAGECRLEIGEALARLIESGKQVLLVQNDVALASGTCETVVTAYPGDRLLGFAAALRAGDFDRLIGEQILGHDGTPSVGVATPMVAESGVASAMSGSARAADLQKLKRGVR